MRVALLRLLAVRPDRVLLRLVAALAIVAALTALQHWGMARFEPDPALAPLRPLQAPPDEAARLVRPAPGQGRVDLAPGSARLVSPGEQGIVAVRLAVPADRPLAGVRVAARLSSEAVRPAGDWRSGAHLRVVGVAEDGRPLFDRELHLARLVGTRTAFWVRRDVPLPPGSHGAFLVAELVRAKGELQLDELSLVPLRERPLFRLARAALIFGWIVVGGWTVLRLLALLRSPLLAGALGLAASAAIVLLVLPRSPEQQLLHELAQLLGLGSVDPGALGDLGHVLMFAALALVATAAVRGLSPWIVLLTLAIAAPLAELVQLVTIGRSAEAADALRNLLGVAVGGGLGLLLRRLPRARAALDRGSSA